MYVFDLSDLKFFPSNPLVISVRQLRIIPGLIIDFRPNESSFDLKASLGFFT